MPSDQFLLSLQQIHNNRQKHTLEDLVAVADLYIAEIGQQIEDNRLYTAVETSELITYWLEDVIAGAEMAISANAAAKNLILFNFSNGQRFNGYDFNFSLDSADDSLLEKLKGKCFELAAHFPTLFERISEVEWSITLERLKNPIDGTDDYTPKGFLIMDTAVESPGYHVFVFDSNENDGKYIPIKFTPLTKHGFGSIDDAIKFAIQSRLPGTFLLATNTLGYPLKETTLPVISQRYDNLLRMNHTQEPPI